MISNYDNIPEELKTLQQWVCFNILPPLKPGGKPRKVPYIAGSNNEAASNRPTEWRSFRVALKDVESGKRQHIGFCVASTDPYVFIDLDDPQDSDQQKVFKRIKTYAQSSVSGEGAHLICKGSFKGSGKHPAYPAAGLFKENRFILMTGDVIKNRNTINVVADEDLQAIHTWLSNGKGDDAESVSLTEYVPTIPDMTIFEIGCDRFLKYRDMSNGKWEQFEEFNNDHSTADHAFLAMLCDLTESNEQVRYLFAVSGMWDETRAAKKSGHGFEGYVNRTIQKIRSKQMRDALITENIVLSFEEDKTTLMEAAPITPVKVKGNKNLIESLPEGLIKDLARYSYQTSYLPLQEASILAALMFVSGLCGRGYLTPTKSGLNLWLVLVGGTSCGKDEYQNGMKRVISAVSKKVPHIRKIFGGEIVSGPGIEAVFQDTFRYISYVPEFGDTFKLLANPQAPEYVKTLSRGLLNSYNAAGQGGSSEGRRKAQGSDEKVFVERPCLCIAGEATPESLYGSMTSRELATGFLQRFILLDVPLSSWSLEENKRHGAAPPKELVTRLEQLALAMDTADVNGQFTVIEASKEADDILKNYRDSKRLEIMACSDGLAKKEVINRAGLKAIRIASLVAVSSDFYAPRIEVAHALWAIDFVERADKKILKRFESGEIGSGQVKQETEIIRACKNILAMTYLDKRSLGMSKKIAKDDLVIPAAIIKKLVVNNASFASDRLGAVTAFDKCIESMCKSGVFVKLGDTFALEKYDHLHGVLLCMNRDTLQ
jgi:Protein of unknown function (DUF3987)